MSKHRVSRGRLFPSSIALCLFSVAAPLFAAETESRGKPWPRHVIDDSSRGADGVKLADVNGDGLPDIVTGWEEGGITRVYLHPGYENAAQRWPGVTVGKTPSVEDATFVDLDADGRIDVVSCCEGGTRTMFVHWAPKNPEDYLDETAWKTERLPASEKVTMWMFCLPMQVDGRHGIDLVAAGKGQGCHIGWFEAPKDSRQLGQWKWHPISAAGWVMSLRTVDMDGDGDLDVVTTDRKRSLRGCRWLENPGPGPEQSRPWKNHFIGGRDKEVMFMTIADLDADGTDDVICAARDSGLLFFRRHEGEYESWEPFTIDMPENVGTGKAVEVADLDRNGRPDIVFSCENAHGEKSGVVWLSFDAFPDGDGGTAHEVSGPVGIKFDRMELVDTDGDGDLDILACEESQPVAGRRQGLGVFWYENPIASRTIK